MSRKPLSFDMVILFCRDSKKKKKCLGIVTRGLCIFKSTFFSVAYLFFPLYFFEEGTLLPMFYPLFYIFALTTLPSYPTKRGEGISGFSFLFGETNSKKQNGDKREGLFCFLLCKKKRTRGVHTGVYTLSKFKKRGARIGES